jgi:RimJ/RimL family protein N-acetyltransferase
MIYRLDRRAYARTRPLFTKLDHQLTAMAVIEGSCPGSIWVDGIAQPRTAFMASPEGHYLVGYEGNAAVNRALNQLIMCTLLGTGRNGQQVEVIVLVCHPEAWERELDVVLAGRVPIPERRWHYRLERSLVDWRNQVPEGFSIERLDQPLLDRPGLGVPEHVILWMKHNWGSMEDFFQRGLGFCAVHENQIVSWCLTDCTSGSACEIGIRTLPEYRRRGLATVTVAATVDECRAQGLTTIGWHCHETNLGSRGVAEKVGFEKVREYMNYLCFADQDEHGRILERLAPGVPG